MKHNLKITLVILVMFLITQFFGLYVVNSYFSNDLPFGLNPPEPETTFEFGQVFTLMIFAFIIAVTIFIFLTKFNIDFLIKFWFFSVVVVALAISFNILLINFLPERIISSFLETWILAIAIALPFGFVKIYRRNFFVHNFTEILIYPGIAAIFVPILNIYTISLLLVIISIYDMWAVWHSGLMQRMAKYQIEKLNIFSGFFVPYVSKRMKLQIKKLSKNQLSKKKFRVNLAVLGGGDVVFPIIASGVMLKTLGLFPAIFVIVGATLGLCYLMFFAEKKKFYPAMPFISAGIFLGMFLGYLLF